VAGIHRNGWPEWSVISGRDRAEYAIKAYVVLKEDIKEITGYDLIKWFRKHLVPKKVPQYVEFRDMLPKSKVGKLLRREIRDEEKRRGET
jgi:long-chain acyl-CoA synthetase